MNELLAIYTMLTVCAVWNGNVRNTQIITHAILKLASLRSQTLGESLAKRSTIAAPQLHCGHKYDLPQILPRMQFIVWCLCGRTWGRGTRLLQRVVAHLYSSHSWYHWCQRGAAEPTIWRSFAQFICSWSCSLHYWLISSENVGFFTSWAFRFYYGWHYLYAVRSTTLYSVTWTIWMTCSKALWAFIYARAQRKSDNFREYVSGMRNFVPGKTKYGWEMR